MLGSFLDILFSSSGGVFRGCGGLRAYLVDPMRADCCSGKRFAGGLAFAVPLNNIRKGKRQFDDTKWGVCQVGSDNQNGKHSLAKRTENRKPHPTYGSPYCGRNSGAVLRFMFRSRRNREQFTGQTVRKRRFLTFSTVFSTKCN